MFSASEGPVARFNISDKGLRKVTSALWGTLDEFIVTGHENGELVQWDIKVNIQLRRFFKNDKENCLGFGTCSSRKTTHRTNHGLTNQ